MWSPKGTTLRVIRCPTILVSQFLFPDQRSVTFLTDLVFFPARPDTEKYSRIQTWTLGEHSPPYTTIKNWVAQFKRGDFSTCDAPHPGRPKMTTPGITEQIHDTNILKFAVVLEIFVTSLLKKLLYCVIAGHKDRLVLRHVRTVANGEH